MQCVAVPAKRLTDSPNWPLQCRLLQKQCLHPTERDSSSLPLPNYYSRNQSCQSSPAPVAIFKIVSDPARKPEPGVSLALFNAHNKNSNKNRDRQENFPWLSGERASARYYLHGQANRKALLLRRDRGTQRKPTRRRYPERQGT